MLLLDEPFGALDAKVRVELRRWLRRLHDADRPDHAVRHPRPGRSAGTGRSRGRAASDGRIEQVGTPDEIYREPASAFVFDFIGRANALEGRVEDGSFIANGQSLRLPLMDDPPHGRRAGRGRDHGGSAHLYVRPHDFAVVAAGDGWPARVIDLHRLADRVTLELDVEGQARPLELDLSAAPDQPTPAPGSTIGLKPLRYRVYPA